VWPEAGQDGCRWSGGGELLLEDFAGELLDRLLLFLGGVPQGQEALLIDLNLEVPPFDVRFEIDRQ
jgi:hypothetical protein